MTGTISLIARNVVWLGAGEVLLKGALFAAGVAVARGLGQAAMGIFTVSFGAALVLMQVLAGGQVEVLIRESAREPDSAKALYRQSRLWQGRIAVVAVPAVMLAAAGLVKDDPLRWTLLVFVPYAWLRAWLITAGAVFKGRDRMEMEVGARGIEVVAALGLLGVVAWMGLPVWLVGAAFAIGAWLGASWIVSRLRQLPGAAQGPMSARGLANQGWPFLVLAVLTQWLLRGDVLVQAGLGVPVEQTGLYGAAAASVWGLFGVAQLVAVAAYPTVARRAAAGGLDLALVVALAAGGLGVGAVGGAVLWVFRAPLMVGLFGAAFTGSLAMVEILVWALPGACASMVLGIVVAACRRQAAALPVQGLIVLVSLAGNLFLVPRLGAVGSAWAAVGAHVLSCISMTALAIWSVVAARSESVMAGPGFRQEP